MIKRNALIFSSNNNIAKIVFAELSLLGYSPKIIQDVPQEKDVELIVFDTTNLEMSATLKSFVSSCHEAGKLAIITNSNQKLSAEFDKRIVFPFLLSEFRDAVSHTTAKQFEKENENHKNSALSKCFIADKDKKGVSFGEVFIPLSEHEFSLLSLLCQNFGNCVSRKDILALFGADDSNIAEVYICHLRNKLEIPFGIKAIYTVRGKGYMTDYTLR